MSAAKIMRALIIFTGSRPTFSNSLEKIKNEDHVIAARNSSIYATVRLFNNTTLIII